MPSLPLYFATFLAWDLCTLSAVGHCPPANAVITRQGPPPNKVGVLLGNSAGSFAPFQAYPIGGIADNILAGDFNGDGRLDLVTNDLSVLLNGSGITGGTANQRFVDQLYHDLRAVAESHGKAAVARALRSALVNGSKPRVPIGFIDNLPVFVPAAVSMPLLILFTESLRDCGGRRCSSP